MNEAELRQGSPEAIEIGAHFPFGNSFAHSMFCPICCFPQGHSDLLLQIRVADINLNWPTLVAEQYFEL